MQMTNCYILIWAMAQHKISFVKWNNTILKLSTTDTKNLNPVSGT